MVFNFKNNNFIIIFLLVLVIGSCVCYNIMQNNVEGFTDKSKYGRRPLDYFTQLNKSKYIDGERFDYYKLNDSKYDFSLNDSFPNFDSNDPDISNSNNSYFDNSWNDTTYNFYRRKNSKEITLNKIIDGELRLEAKIGTENTNPDNVGSVNFLFTHKTSDFSYNIYDLSFKRMIGLNINISGEQVIHNGQLRSVEPPEDIAERYISDGTVTAEGGSFSMGDFINKIGLGAGLGGGIDPHLRAYMLETGNRHPYLSNYSPPFYSSFESAMNNPSNPLVNPINSMNPQQYSESLFGPNVSPHMVQEMCKNSKLSTDSKVESSDLKKEESSDLEKEEPSDLEKEESSDVNVNKNGIENSLQSTGNPMNDIFNRINSNSNTLLTQNSNTPTNTPTNNGGEVPPCPPCARCPQSDFECKKVPNYEQGLENSSLPRPILSNFSTFGM